jgi:cilia- and flagella-associated protein 52
VQRLKLHKVLIQSLSFSHDEKYLASLGGQDDNTLVIWDVSTTAAHPPLRSIILNYLFKS